MAYDRGKTFVESKMGTISFLKETSLGENK